MFMSECVKVLEAQGVTVLEHSFLGEVVPIVEMRARLIHEAQTLYHPSEEERFTRCLGTSATVVGNDILLSGQVLWAGR